MVRVTCIALICWSVADRLQQSNKSGPEPDPLSDEFIELINSQQTTWRAGRNFAQDTTISYIKGLMGSLILRKDNHEDLPNLRHADEVIANLPENFDTRDKWPNCPTLNEISDQGSCGGCWAFAAVGAMTDRICIYSNGAQNVQLSAEDLLSCCSSCGNCFSGDPYNAWRFYQESGLVSGGPYNSGQGCRPYTIIPCDHKPAGRNRNRPRCTKPSYTPKCVQACENSYYNSYVKDKHFAKNIYKIENSEDQIRAELYKNGPVQAGFIAYADFPTYKEGVYQHTYGKTIGLHTVKILGWGVENGVKYWLTANSWNSDWGDNGYFKILRGENHCDIENYIVAGEPLL